jgi:hypothetical protein
MRTLSLALAVSPLALLMQGIALADGTATSPPLVASTPVPLVAATPAPVVMPIPARGLPVPSSGGFMHGHLPIVELDVQSDFADPGGTTNTKSTGLNGVVSGTLNFAGSFTIPITDRISASFVRDAGGDLNTTFGRTTLVGGAYEQLGSLKRHDDTEKIDIGLDRGFTFEGGLEHNYFECCLALEDHTGYVALQYASPGIRFLHGLHFDYTEKAITAAHNPSVNTLASQTPGLDVGKREYGLDQVLVAVLPVNRRVYVTGTFFNGAYDFFENEPFPFRYNIFIETADFSLAKNATFELAALNLTQINTGAPFPAPNTIHFVNFYATMKFNMDFNKIR